MQVTKRNKVVSRIMKSFVSNTAVLAPLAKFAAEAMKAEVSASGKGNILMDSGHNYYPFADNGEALHFLPHQG